MIAAIPGVVIGLCVLYVVIHAVRGKRAKWIPGTERRGVTPDSTPRGTPPGTEGGFSHQRSGRRLFQRRRPSRVPAGRIVPCLVRHGPVRDATDMTNQT